MSSEWRGPPGEFSSAYQPRKPWGTLRIIATVLVVVLVALLLLAVTTYVLVINSFNQRAAAVPAPIAWKSAQVVLSAEEPIADGAFSVIAAGGSPSNTVVGVNAGLPRAGFSASATNAPAPAASVDPAALLSIPTIRISATTGGQGAAQSCVAPCELTVRSAFNCAADPCRIDIDFRVELIREGTPSSTSVTVDLSGAIATELANALPAGLQLDFTVGDGGDDGS